VDTFVIRLWSPADPAADAGDAPHGIARHVATGRSAPFRDGGELLTLLRDLPRPDVQRDPPTPTLPGDTER
jgi:hypothetical protein